MISKSASLSQVDLLLLVLLTLFWGVNWPVMKYALLDYPPLTFRALCMLIGIVALGAYILATGDRFQVPRDERRRVLELSVGNMMIWHFFAMYAIKMLSSGRAAIIGYTMPVWALLASVLFFRGALTWRGGLGVVLAMAATVLLAANEFSSMLGKPLGLGLMMVAAISWGVGTAMMNHIKVSISNATLTFWMMVLTAGLLVTGALLTEWSQWRWPRPGEWAAILYNAVIVFGVCHIIWFRIARKLPPTASSLSIMLIPVVGVFTGAWALGETIGPYDIGALALILMAMAVVLLPKREPKPGTGTEPQ